MSGGRPNGIVRELAVNLIKDIIPKPGKAEVLTAMQEGMAVLLSLGITAVHDFQLMGGLEGATALAAWGQLRESGTLNLRFLLQSCRGQFGIHMLILDMLKRRTSLFAATQKRD